MEVATEATVAENSQKSTFDRRRQLNQNTELLSLEFFKMCYRIKDK